MNLYIQFDFLQPKAKELQGRDKLIYDAVDNDIMEFEMISTRKYEEKLSRQSTWVHCALDPHPPNDMAALLPPASIDMVAQGNTIDTVSPPATSCENWRPIQSIRPTMQCHTSEATDSNVFRQASRLDGIPGPFQCNYSRE